ncbi:GTPase HflX [Collinsella sp. zg1085]|uniref:GTPase HflX n=1 Tax=Collinsella sp. zg1085 TaxID=2844380 RepID=UPI001C0D6D69|nr:GTPase HflX [Collinsella sp. zg1085]QWT17001.1 GTPase HflX [Collinsella sp. zg1085]
MKQTNTKLIETALKPERALLMGIETPYATWPLNRSLEELARLADTAGVEVISHLSQRLVHPHPRSFIGSGKLEELKHKIDRLSIDVVIFDDDLSPAQQSHIEKALGEPVKVIDRTALILDIFGRHAVTREGRLQVQLAQLQYLLPRLRGMWSHLANEQSRGGICSRFGQGESQLEIDRRLVRDRISALQRQLKELERRRRVQAQKRLGSDIFRVALAGYTNAGKSSLLNRLTNAQVLAEDKLFATLDATTRTLVLPGNRRITITDTVGFIQKLPHKLVESFRSTLSEVLSADLILIVVDASDVDAERHLVAVQSVLREIGADEHISVVVYNKIDALNSLERDHITAVHPDAISCSALDGRGIDTLLKRLSLEARTHEKLMSIRIPYSRANLLDQIHREAHVLQEEYQAEGIYVVIRCGKKLQHVLEGYQEEAKIM